MKHNKNKSSNNSNAPSTSPSKGKGDRGKGKGSSDSGTNKISVKDRRDSIAMVSDKELRGDNIDLKDCPLRLPEFANIDHAKLVPRYTSGETKGNYLT